MIQMVDQVKLDYWKDRLRKAKAEQWKRPVTIEIVPDTLEWFIETIEYLQNREAKL